ncbi:MAG: UDP-N-acetylmuramate dehydrogenase, partial [Actinomycetales bacterium]|nr:UDP-N-acetylmuramate dehydrogenase [Actinomycetales bacterium]
TTREELIETALDVWASSEPWLLLGGGSNTIVSDEGFDGTVILISTRGISEASTSFIVPEGRVASGPGAPTSHEGSVIIRAQAGEPWDNVVAFAVSHGLAGLEALSGIPGSTGATPVQNIGAYGQEVADVIVSVEFLDYLAGEVQTLSISELGFGYRDSIFKRGRLGVVLSVDFALTPSWHSDAVSGATALSLPIVYPQLADALGVTLRDRAELARVREAVLALRASKGMVLDATDTDTVSVGSFFVNPIVTESFARTLPAGAPRYPVEAPIAHRIMPLDGSTGTVVPGLGGPTRVKLSAAWLIEAAGVKKGFGVPGSGAAISSKHTLAITNRGGATSDDILGLARYVQALVQSHFGLILQPEPNLIGLEI